MGYLLAGLLVHVGVPVLYHPDGEVPQLLEVVGGIVYVLPVEAQPFDVFQYVLHVLGVLLAGVGVVEAQVADTVIFLRHAEIHADGFRVAYVQVSVRLWREARLYASPVLARCQVILY